MNQKHDYTITARSRKRRARLKAEREASELITAQEAAVASQLAAEQHRLDLDNARAALGLAPRKSGKQRTAEWRARKAAKAAAEQAERDRPTPINEIVNFTF
jgi:hypothetical protein